MLAVWQLLKGRGLCLHAAMGADQCLYQCLCFATRPLPRRRNHSAPSATRRHLVSAAGPKTLAEALAMDPESAALLSKLRELNPDADIEDLLADSSDEESEGTEDVEQPAATKPSSGMLARQREWQEQCKLKVSLNELL
ncbi:unnamed protein product [Chrysoparadoxa australica]